MVVLPLTIPQLKMSKKQRDIQPEIDKLKAKYKHDQKKLAEMQMALFQKHGINPMMGCFTMVLTLAIIIPVYNAIRYFTDIKDVVELNKHIFIESLKFSPEAIIDTRFLYLDLTRPDQFMILTILVVVLQVIMTKMMMPYVEASEKAATKTPSKTDDFMANFQKQNMLMMPIMYLIFGFTLPSGVMLYMMVSAVMQIAQTYYYNGVGGLKPWIAKIKEFIGRKKQ